MTYIEFTKGTNIMKKKLLSILLSLAMVVTMMPAMVLTAFAIDETPLPEDTLDTDNFLHH